MNFKDGSSDGGWGCVGGGCLITVVVLVIACAFAMVLGALGIGAANAWFLNADFSAGWHAAWAKPFVLLGWTVLFYGILGAAVFGRD